MPLDAMVGIFLSHHASNNTCTRAGSHAGDCDIMLIEGVVRGGAFTAKIRFRETR